ncbi:hypothetical protein BJV77DRAFT_248978 [Russula vinacea]|nr:hypothetical protein BJV77DRAFT_248978 [Russula vinacea]
MERRSCPYLNYPKRITCSAATYRQEIHSRDPPNIGCLDPSSEHLLGSPSIAGGDEDADGEVDPDYSHVFGAKNRHQAIAHQPDGEVTFSKTIKDTLSPKVTIPGLESHPTSPSVHRQESKAVGKTSQAHCRHPCIQDSPSAESGVVQDKGDFAAVVQSEVKASDEREHQTRALKRKRKDPKPDPLA